MCGAGARTVIFPRGRMKVLQILPELHAGGVECSVLEIARHLVQQGHEALVVSHGGRLVAGLEAFGARHIAMPVHRKRLSSVFQVARLRRLLALERPDLLHLQSRVPGWIGWLAWRKLPPASGVGGWFRRGRAAGGPCLSLSGSGVPMRQGGILNGVWQYCFST